MKISLITFIFFFTSIFLHAQIITIQDINFKNKLLQADSNNAIAVNLNGDFFRIDSNQDGQFQLTELLEVSYLDVQNSNISDLSGINFFSNLEHLSCYNNLLTVLDVSNLTSLKTLHCGKNSISLLDLTSNVNLLSLDCYINNLTSLNVSNATSLNYLNCIKNKLTNLNINSNSHLQILLCDENKLTNLDVSQNSELIAISCSINLISNIDTTNNPNLSYLNCVYNPIPSIDVSQNLNLNTLNFGGNNLITEIDVSNNLFLEEFVIVGTAITSLDLTNNLLLNRIGVMSTVLSTLDLNPFVNLFYLLVESNQNLESLFIKNNSNEIIYLFENPNLNFICADNFQLTDVISISNNGAVVTDDCSLTNNEINFKNKFTLTPNPTTSKFIIESGNLFERIEIIDLFGKVIESKDVFANQFEYDLSNYSRGVYFVKIYYENKFVLKKVVKY